MPQKEQKKLINASIAVKASLWFTVCNVLQKAMQFLLIPVYTRTMRVDQYGQYAVYLSWHEIISILATFGMWNSFINNVMAKYSYDKDRALAAIQGLSTTITIVFFIIYILISNPFQKLTGLSSAVMSILFIELLVYPSYGYYIGKKRYEYEYRPIVILTVAQTVLVPLISVPMILAVDEKGIAAIAGRSLTLAVIYLIPAFVIWKKGRLFYNKEYWRYALKYSLPLIPHYLSMIIMQQSDRIMLEQICGKFQAGIYALAYQAASIIQVINSAIVVTYTPYVYQKLQNKDISNIAKYGYILLGLVIGLNLALILVAPEAIMLMGTDEYRKAIYIVPPVAISTVFIFMFNMFANFEYYFEETKFIPLASILAGISNIVLNAIFIPKYGMYAAGYTTLFCYVLFSLGHFCYMRIVCKKYLFGAKVFNGKALVAVGSVAIVLGLAITALYDYWWVRYGGLCLGAILAIYLYKRKNLCLIISSLRAR